MSSSSTPSVWDVPASTTATATINVIRAIVDRIKLPTHHSPTEKPLIPLSIGDPTIFGNLHVPPVLVQAMMEQVQGGKANGYAPSVGSVAARQAIADRYSYPSPFYPYLVADGEDEAARAQGVATVPVTKVTPNDVVITSGCSGALSIAIEAIASPGDNILLPQPGFPLYQTICGRNNIETRHYRMQAANNWEIDLPHLRSLVDKRTRAILVNNPSNPNGSNWSRRHIEEILAVAEEFKLPIIADEVYADMIFDGEQFFPFAALSRTVPILCVGGIAKQFVCPGWRLGWLIIYEKSPFNSTQAHANGSSAASSSDAAIPTTTMRRIPFREGVNNLSQIIIGANTLVQACLPALLSSTDRSPLQDTMRSLQASAKCVERGIATIPGLSCATPQGAMYIMVHIDTAQFRDIPNDEVFAQLLLDEENVFVLPGKCFGAPSFVRFVVCAPEKVLDSAIVRMKKFCERHRK